MNSGCCKIVEDIPHCTCGRTHTCAVDHVIIGKDILGSLVELCKEYEGIMLVSDKNTYQVCGKDVADILGNQIVAEVMFETKSETLVPNEEALEQLYNALSERVDLVLGVGSGVINDLCKIVSFENKLPYYIVATAPSMDGYASAGAALILKGMKVTLNAVPPNAILADTSVLKDSPMDMIRAGYGDIIGKYSCLNDWRLGAAIHDEYFCQHIYDMVYQTADHVRDLAENLVKRDEEAIRILMEALVTVGVCMAYVGNSRPASGSEHHLSHYFEITGLLNQQAYLPHGVDVANSAILTARLREQIVKSIPERREFNEEQWKEAIRRIYKSSADEVIRLQDNLGWYKGDDSESVMSKWDQIRDILEEAPTEAEMLKMVEAVGMDYQKFIDLYGQDKINDAILYAKDLKDRYSVLWLYYEFFR